MSACRRRDCSRCPLRSESSSSGPPCGDHVDQRCVSLLRVFGNRTSCVAPVARTASRTALGNVRRCGNTASYPHRRPHLNGGTLTVPPLCEVCELSVPEV